jgi:hypothetical protein
MQTELQLLLANFDLFGELSQVLNVSGIARNSLGRQSVKQPASLETFYGAIADNLSNGMLLSLELAVSTMPPCAP